MGARKEPEPVEVPCVVCGLEADLGCTGQKGGEVYNIHYCTRHYFETKVDHKEALAKRQETLKIKKKKQALKAEKASKNFLIEQEAKAIE